MIKSHKIGSTRPHSAAMTRIHSLAHRRADEIVKNFGPTGKVVGYRKALAL